MPGHEPDIKFTLVDNVNLIREVILALLTLTELRPVPGLDLNTNIFRCLSVHVGITCWLSKLLEKIASERHSLRPILRSGLKIKAFVPKKFKNLNEPRFALSYSKKRILILPSEASKLISSSIRD